MRGLSGPIPLSPTPVGTPLSLPSTLRLRAHALAHLGATGIGSAHADRNDGLGEIPATVGNRR